MRQVVAGGAGPRGDKARVVLVDRASGLTFSDMIDILVEHGGDPAGDAALLRALPSHLRVVKSSARGGAVRRVREAESAVRLDPSAFTFTPAGATLKVGEHSWHAGHFEPVTIGDLRTRVAALRGGAPPARVHLYVVEGDEAPTDIGSLQAHAGASTLFQVASQFNCLEAPGPSLTAVERYLTDPTQGPRASISAFPATLLRHYAAPGASGERFVQTSDGRQIELLGEVCDPGVARVRNGYLLAEEIAEPSSFLHALATRFDAIRVGVHDDVEVVLGYDWDGDVARHPRIGQVFTSTLAAGAYGSASGIFEEICGQLLRAAYLGTLLAALALRRSRVVLTLIGGGVFGNPGPLIWEALTWALDQVAPLATADLAVIVNGRNLGGQLDPTRLLREVRSRNGLLLSWPRGEAPRIAR